MLLINGIAQGGTGKEVVWRLHNSPALKLCSELRSVSLSRRLSSCNFATPGSHSSATYHGPNVLVIKNRSARWKLIFPQQRRKARPPTLPYQLNHQTWSCENTIVTLKSKSSKPRGDAQLYSSTRSGPLTTSDQRICHQNVQRWTCQDVRERCFWNCQTSVFKVSLQHFWCTQKSNREYTPTKRHT